MDKRIFMLGMAILVGGIGVYGYLSENVPAGKADMTEDEKYKLAQDEIMNAGLRNIAGMLGGVGFFITLISLGLKRRRKGEPGKTISQKPAQT